MIENSEVCRSQLGDGSYEDGEAYFCGPGKPLMVVVYVQRCEGKESSTPRKGECWGRNCTHLELGKSSELTLFKELNGSSVAGL